MSMHRRHILTINAKMWRGEHLLLKLWQLLTSTPPAASPFLDTFVWHAFLAAFPTQKIYTTQAAAEDIYVLLCEKGKWKNDPDSRLCIALYSPDFFWKKKLIFFNGNFILRAMTGGNKWWHCILKCFSLITKYYSGWMEAAVAAYFSWKFRGNVFCFNTSERHFLACNLPFELTQA